MSFLHEGLLTVGTGSAEDVPSEGQKALREIMTVFAAAPSELQFGIAVSAILSMLSGAHDVQDVWDQMVSAVEDVLPDAIEQFAKANRTN